MLLSTFVFDTAAIAGYQGVFEGACGMMHKRFTNSIGQEFVYIEPGTFMMGSPDDEPGRCNDEVLHEVTLSKGFYLQTTAVTNEQWFMIMGTHRFPKDDEENLPVTVFWENARKYIARLKEIENRKYRLPTEAEWEYACRAGTRTPFFFGPCLSTDEANHRGSFPLEGCPPGEDRKKKVPVGSFPPNAWGLYDMHGNVCEWCQDRYLKYHPPTAVVDPVIDPAAEPNPIRVVRGGSFFFQAKACRSASRYSVTPCNPYINTGFRLVLELELDSAGREG